MTDSEVQQMVIDGVVFDSTNVKYSKPKVNNMGGKSVNILSSSSNKTLHLATPLLLTWGVNEYRDDKTGKLTYDMTLQFPKDDYSNPQTQSFLNNLKKFEEMLKSDAITYSKDWMNKAKLTPEVVDALWTPMLKYPKDQTTQEFDYDRAPGLRVKVPYYEGEFNSEVYDLEGKALFPNDAGNTPVDLISKGANVATVIQCGGLWFANGKFGVTWRLVQAVVKPKASLRGKCLIKLSSADRETLEKHTDETPVESEAVEVEDSSDEEEIVVSDDKVAISVETPPSTPKVEEPPPPPKKKVVRRKVKSDD